MAKIRAAPKDGDTRALVFDASPGRRGRSMSGLLGIYYEGEDLKTRLAPGKYKVVTQKLRRGRWAHVGNAEVEIATLPA